MFCTCRHVKTILNRILSPTPDYIKIFFILLQLSRLTQESRHQWFLSYANPSHSPPPTTFNETSKARCKRQAISDARRLLSTAFKPIRKVSDLKTGISCKTAGWIAKTLRQTDRDEFFFCLVQRQEPRLECEFKTLVLQDNQCGSKLTWQDNFCFTEVIEM